MVFCNKLYYVHVTLYTGLFKQINVVRQHPKNNFIPQVYLATSLATITHSAKSIVSIGS